MGMNNEALIPSAYDPVYLRDRANLFSASWDEDRSGETYVFRTDSEAAWSRLIEARDAYPVTYLADQLRPRLLREMSVERDRKIASFTFSGMSIALDAVTRANLTAAVVGLDRCADVDAIEWSLGEGHFVTLQREDVLALADAAFRYVQACFAAHKLIADEIKAAETIDDVAGLDLAAHEAWPA